MQADNIVDLGNHLEAIWVSPYFQQLVDLFELSTAKLILATKPEAKDEREIHFHSLLGAREFLSFMREAIAQKDAIIAAAQPKEPDIDDPSVHDIYREHD